MSFVKRLSIALVAGAMSFGTLTIGSGSALFTGMAQAQEISEDHLAAAKRAIEASRSTEQLDEILPRMAQNAKAELIRSNPDKEAEISLIVDESALSLASRRGDLESEAAQIFARVFTVEELNTISDFYKSETGQKFLSQSPLVLREIQRASRVWTNGIQRDLAQAVQTKMTEAGLR